MGCSDQKRLEDLKKRLLRTRMMSKFLAVVGGDQLYGMEKRVAGIGRREREDIPGGERSLSF